MFIEFFIKNLAVMIYHKSWFEMKKKRYLLIIFMKKPVLIRIKGSFSVTKELS